jgi:hypothetical protein
MIRHTAISLAALLSTFCIVSGIMLIQNIAIAEFQILEMGGTVSIRDKILSYYMPAICIIMGIVLQIVTIKVYTQD